MARWAGSLPLSEAYPDLKANQTMMQLSEELTSTENKVSFARQAYNDAVMSYNNSPRSVPEPTSRRQHVRFQPAQPLDIAKPEAREAPKVSVHLTAGAPEATPVDFYAYQAAARGQTRCWYSPLSSALPAVALALDSVVFTVSPTQLRLLLPNAAQYGTQSPARYPSAWRCPPPVMVMCCLMGMCQPVQIRGIARGRRSGGPSLGRRTRDE